MKTIKRFILSLSDAQKKSLLNLYVIFFVFFLISDCLDVFVPLYFVENNLSLIGLGIVQSLTLGLRFVFILILSKQKNQLRKWWLLLILIVNSSSILITVLWLSEYYFYFVMILLLATRSAINVVFNPAVARLVTKENLGIGFGIRDIFLNLGSCIGLLLAGWLTIYHSQNIFIMFIFIGYIILMLLIWRFYSFYNKNNSDKTDEQEVQEEDKKGSFKQLFLSLVKKHKPDFYYICFSSCLISLGMIVLSNYMPIYGNALNINANNIYILFSSSVFVTALLSLVGGIIIDKYSKKLLYQLYILLCLISTALLLPNSKALFVISLILLSIRGVLDNIEQAYFFELNAEEDIEKLWAVLSMLNMFVSFAGPIILGYIIESSMRTALTVSITILFVALLLSFGLEQKGKTIE